MNNESTTAVHLHAAYLARRKQYVDEINERTNAALSKKLAHAAATADLCLTTFVFFAEQITELSKRRQASVATASSEARAEAVSALAQVEELEQKLTSETDPVLRALHLQNVKLNIALANSALGRADAQITLYQTIAELSQALLSLNRRSLEDLLTVSNAEDVRRVLGAIAKAFVGMIPVVGNTLSGLLESWSLWQERRPGFETKTKSTNDILNHLDAFVYASYQWCLIVELAVDALNGVADPKVDQAAQRVSSRFDALVSRV